MIDVYVYDFDKTIYDGDVTYDFYKYCLKNCHKTWKYLIFQIWFLIRYILGLDQWTQFKSNMFGYIKYIKDIDLILDNFWLDHKYKIKDWYLKKNHSNDVIISASPEFLLNKICYDYLNVRLLIGTVADKHTGKISGKNCFGNQKVIRLNEKLKNYNILEFYSDSLSDNPLAKISKKSYIVNGNNVLDWGLYKLPKKDKLMSIFMSRDFILFILIGVINTFNAVIFALIFKHFILNRYIAFMCGYVFSNLVAYLLNSAIIFKENISLVKFLKFFISYIPNFAIQLIIIFLVCNILGLFEWLAYIIAAILGVPITFLFLKIFAFKQQYKRDINPYIYKEL